MRRLAVVALLAALATQASADEDDYTEAVEKPTSVAVSLVGTTARIQARFAFEIEGPGVGLNVHTFAIPAESVVTAGTVIVDGVRHKLRLEKAAAADRAFDALTLKPGNGGQRAWAFLLDGGSSSVTLDVLAPRNAHIVLELKLDARTCFFDDIRYVELPTTWWQRAPQVQRDATHRKQADIATGCRRDELDETTRWLGFPSMELAMQPAGERRIGATVGRLPLETMHFARVELDVARKLTEVPRDLHTAIVIDHSRSLTTEELESQRAVVLAYVRAAPTSRVQVIGYARRAEALLPSWMTASHAAPQIDRAIRALPPRNGSNVDAALTEAVTWLSRVKGTKRILLFSDERLADRFGEPTVLAPLVPDDVLVHVVHPTVGAGISRMAEDDSPLGQFAKATEGIAVFAGVDELPVVDPTMLLRPVSIDQLEVTASGWKTVEDFADPRGCTESLHEGATCTWWGEGNGAAGPITINGRLWNRPIKRMVHADPSQARTLARWLSLLNVLDPALQEQVDHAALALNSVWSLFGQWGAAGGYEDVNGFGTFGFGRVGTISHDSGIVDTIGRASAGLDLRDQLKQAIAGCKPGTARGGIQVETTLEEIVGVDVDVEPANPTLQACLVEAVWDTTLRIPSAPHHTASHVAFGNKR